MLQEQFLVDVKPEEFVLVPIDADYFDLAITLHNCPKHKVIQFIPYQDEDEVQFNEPARDVDRCLNCFFVSTVGARAKHSKHTFDQHGDNQSEVDEQITP